MEGLLHPPSLAKPRAGVSRVSLSEALDLGAPAWDAVLDRSASRSPFMGWEWHRAWADSAPPEELEASEALLLHGPDGSLQALLPFRLGRVRFHRVWVRALSWAIGDVGCPDDLDVPALPDADLSALAAGLEALPWQVLILSNLAEGVTNAERLCAELMRRGHVARQRPLCICPQLELPTSWDAYLATLRRSRRQALRYMERSLRRDHAVALTDYGEDRLEEGWRCLVSLHETRWDGGGAFRDPRRERLQQRFAREMAKRKRLWLTTLDVDGQPAAAWYGFTSDDTVYFYQCGRDPRWERESVGLVLISLMIQRAIERGFRAFNFLRGGDGYKQQWTPSRRMTGEAVVFRSGWGGWGLRALDALATLRERSPLGRGAPERGPDHD